jgi:uncharacterized protein YuzE
MRIRNVIHIETAKPPVVELDSSALAAYVRFSRNPVASTKVIANDKSVVTIDLDKKGKVIGVEVVGVKEFNIAGLLKIADITAPEALLKRARYVPAQLQAA